MHAEKLLYLIIQFIYISLIYINEIFPELLRISENNT